MQTKTPNVVLEGISKTGKLSIEKNGENFSIFKIIKNCSKVWLIGIVSTRTNVAFLVNIEQDKDFKVKFQ